MGTSDLLIIVNCQHFLNCKNIQTCRWCILTFFGSCSGAFATAYNLREQTDTYFPSKTCVHGSKKRSVLQFVSIYWIIRTLTNFTDRLNIKTDHFRGFLAVLETKVDLETKTRFFRKVVLTDIFCVQWEEIWWKVGHRDLLILFSGTISIDYLGNINVPIPKWLHPLPFY